MRNERRRDFFIEVLFMRLLHFICNDVLNICFLTYRKVFTNRHYEGGATEVISVIVFESRDCFVSRNDRSEASNDVADFTFQVTNFNYI